MEIKELADKIVEILENKKGVDIELIPVSEKTVLADYFVICSGTSSTHIKALADEVEYMLKRDYDVTPDHIEGRESARWILLDYKDVVVHVFHPEQRQNYSLEKLWEMKKPAE